MSNQIQKRNGVKNTPKRDNNSKAKVNKGIYDFFYKKIELSSLLIGVSTALRTGSDRAPKRPAKKVARKVGQHTRNPSSKIDWVSEHEEHWDEALPSITPWKKTRSSMNVVLPPSNWPWNADKNHTTGSWTLSPCPTIVSFSSSGTGVMINQRAGNVAHFLNIGNERRSAHRYHYH